MGLDSVSYIMGKKSVPPAPPAPQIKLEEKTMSITSNGNRVITPSTGYDGISKLSLQIYVAVQSISGSLDLFDDTHVGYRFNTLFNSDSVAFFVPEWADSGYILALSLRGPSFIINPNNREYYAGIYVQQLKAFQFEVPDATGIIDFLPREVVAVEG